MKYFCLLFGAGLSLSALAQESTLGSPRPNVAAATLGKLFLTPEKRLSLERQRQLNLSEGDGMDSETLRLDGVVQRSSGYNSIWINQNVQPQTRTSGKATTDASSSPIELDQGQRLRLQVGESVNRNTQERKNVLPPNAIQSGTRH